MIDIAAKAKETNPLIYIFVNKKEKKIIYVNKKIIASCFPILNIKNKRNYLLYSHNKHE
jgi:hypothetical protein